MDLNVHILAKAPRQIQSHFWALSALSSCIDLKSDDRLYVCQSISHLYRGAFPGPLTSRHQQSSQPG